MTRAVVTGLGAVTPVGTGIPAFLEALRTGRRGLVSRPRWMEGDWRSQVAADVVPFPEEPAGLDPAARLAVVAGMQAIADAGLGLEGDARWRAGLTLGTCLGGLASLERFVAGEEDPELLLRYPPAAITQAVAETLGLYGESRTLTTACAAGTDAIGEALGFIRDGRCDVVVAGGTDPLCLLPSAGFNALEALDPEGCRPFDRQRDGASLGEGAAVLVLEAEAHARARGARVYAEVLGYGAVNDAYHTVAPDPTGDGAWRAMTAALADAGLPATALVYVNAHGTGTRANDEMEVDALRRLLGRHRIPVSSTKSQVGHGLGASGSIEAVACCLAIATGVLPPTCGLGDPIVPDMDFATPPGRTLPPGPVLSNSFAFAGHMASLVLGPYQGEPPA